MSMSETIRKRIKKKPKQYHIMAWALPVLAIAVFDASLAMLAIMFIGVPLTILAMLINGILTKYFKLKIELHITSIVAALLVTCVILYWGLMSFTSEEMFKSTVASPIPESAEILDKGGQLSVMGMSSFYIVFNISNEDLDLIIKERNLERKNSLNISGRKPKLYKQAQNEAQEWLNDTSEIYVKDDINSGYRCSVLITNKQHDKVYYRIF